MSSEHELERLLGEARKTLPAPDAEATARARELARGAARAHRPRPARVAALLGASIVPRP